MREKSIPLRSLPLGIVIWERLVKPKPKPKFAKKPKTRDQRYNPIKWKKDPPSAPHLTTTSSLPKQEVVPSDGPSKKGYMFLLQGEHGDESSLTELQKHMIRIIQEQGGSTSIDTLVDEVQKIWDKITRGEEFKYIADSRRAVFATLANSYSSNNPIFVRDLEKGEGWWKLSKKTNNFDLEKIEEESRNLLVGRDADSDEQSDPEDTTNPTDPNEEEDDDHLPVEPLSKRRKRPVVSLDNASATADLSEGSKSEAVSDDQQGKSDDNDSKEMSQLQGLMVESIMKNGGSATLETIQKHVAKFWANLKRRDSNLFNSDYKKVVKSALISDSSIFKKDPNHEGYWKATKTALSLFETVKEQVTEIPRLTGMQDMLMRILLTYGGLCTFEEIYDEVVKNGKSMRHLGSDYKRVSRAILASLSHNPPGNFRKAADGCWTIAPKAMAVAEQMVKEDPLYSLNKVKQDSSPEEDES